MKAIYPGSFDPITYGHLSIIKKALKVFDKVLIGVAENPEKKHMFTQEERSTLIVNAIDADESLRKAWKDGRIDIRTYSWLTVDAAHLDGAEAIVRGLRHVTDYEQEMQLAGANKLLAPDIETVFFRADPEFSEVSSSMLKSIMDNRYGFGDYDETIRLCERKIAPASVCEAIRKKINERKSQK